MQKGNLAGLLLHNHAKVVGTAKLWRREHITASIYNYKPLYYSNLYITATLQQNGGEGNTELHFSFCQNIMMWCAGFFGCTVNTLLCVYTFYTMRDT